MTSVAPQPDPPRRVGRPARIDLDDIARAVIEVGFDEATMRRVAGHMGVSVPGLYYYVRGRDDLLRLAADYSLARTPLPVDEGQHWAQWLREWARYTRNAMAEPQLMEHYISGEIDSQRMFDVIGGALDLLLREGFDAASAFAAWDAVSSVGLGSAVTDLREREATEAGRSWRDQLHERLAEGNHDQSTLRELLDVRIATDPGDAFEERLTTMVVGLASRLGRPIDDDVLGRS